MEHDRMITIPKPNKPSIYSDAYRSIFLLSSLFKIFIQLILFKILAHLYSVPFTNINLVSARNILPHSYRMHWENLYSSHFPWHQQRIWLYLVSASPTTLLFLQSSAISTVYNHNQILLHRSFFLLQYKNVSFHHWLTWDSSQGLIPGPILRNILFDNLLYLTFPPCAMSVWQRSYLLYLSLILPSLGFDPPSSILNHNVIVPSCQFRKSW